MHRGLKTGLIAVAVGLVLYALYLFIDSISLPGADGVCGMSAGPCTGEKIDFKPVKNGEYVYLNCPNGKIGFKPGKKNAPPVLFKIGTDAHIQWAYKFDTEECCGIPMLEISGMELRHQDGENSIYFFNLTYSEPGVFYLTKDFDFDFLCLSPM